MLSISAFTEIELRMLVNTSLFYFLTLESEKLDDWRFPVCLRIAHCPVISIISVKKYIKKTKENFNIKKFNTGKRYFFKAELKVKSAYDKS